LSERPLFIDHVTLRVADVEASRRFYERALAPLGVETLEFGTSVGFGPRGAVDFFVAPGEPGPPVHVAFAAPDRETVDAFHEAALAAGGRDNGPPGLRPQYHAHYYGAFVLDPDGNNVEAVCHSPA
jgi:catechol 2,3-dioxygenase-like lactoylglutathione lyase family enzyme